MLVVVVGMWLVKVTGLCWVAVAGEVVMVGDDRGGGGRGNSDMVAMAGDGDSDVKSMVMVVTMMVRAVTWGTDRNSDHEATSTLLIMNVT